MRKKGRDKVFFLRKRLHDSCFKTDYEPFRLLKTSTSITLQTVLFHKMYKLKEGLLSGDFLFFFTFSHYQINTFPHSQCPTNSLTIFEIVTLPTSGK
ncbi:MAG: hypothetical protein ACI85I_002466 [Arenicella sp.]|jgi:hypothetical protein